MILQMKIKQKIIQNAHIKYLQFKDRDQEKSGKTNVSLNLINQQEKGDYNIMDKI